MHTQKYQELKPIRIHNMKTKKIRLQNALNRTAVLLLVTSFLSACGRNSEDNRLNSNQDQDDDDYAMNVVVSGVGFWADTREAWKAIDEEREDVDTIFGGPIDTDSQKQIDEIDGLIAKGIDGIVVAPADSTELTPAINRAVEKGIPVVTYLVDAPESKRTCYITSELETASQRVVDAVYQDDGSMSQAIVVFAEAGNEEQEARRRGFEIAASRLPNLSVVEVVEDKYDESVGAELLKAALTKQEGVKYIFGCNSRSAIGAVTALKDHSRSKGEVLVTGWDIDKDVLDLVKDGWVVATAAQQSSFMTQLAFSIVEAESEGWLYPRNRSFKASGVRPLPEIITIPIQVVTKDNVTGYFPKN